MANTVTVDRNYLDTLLRKAEYHASSQDSAPNALPYITIPRTEYENYLRIAQEFSSLKSALYRGGIAEATLQILIRGDTETPEPDSILDDEVLLDGDAESRPLGLSRQSGNIYNSSPGQGGGWPPKEQESPQKTKSGFYARQYSFGRDDNSHPSELDKENDSRGPARPQYARAEQRTILAQNLSDRTSHKDLAQVIRGGAVLDIFLRSNERSASVSFLEGRAAQEFMNYVRRSDIYIHGKRVEWTWNDRQFILPGQVAYKISLGATRNLRILNVPSNITEARIREDLDHIHNLVIIDIANHNGNMHIYLNSIHNAIFARTCMLSRLMYKSLKLDWYPDECSSPLPKQPAPPKKENATQQARKPSTPGNRFEMLNIDGSEDSDDTESAEEEPMATAFSSMRLNHRSPWNKTTVVA